MTGHAGGAADLLRTAQEVFGYESLRPGQEEAMRAVLAGRDVLAVMPTGAGKSAVYQVPALLLEGPVVVVSPLIALQRDQVDAIVGGGSGRGGAVMLNSAMTASAWEERARNCGPGPRGSCSSPPSSSPATRCSPNWPTWNPGCSSSTRRTA